MNPSEEEAGAEESFAADEALKPKEIIRPRTVEDARRLLEEACSRREAIIPLGGGAHLTLGNPPNRVGIVLQTTALNRTVEYVPEEMVVTVEAGSRMEAVERMLRGRGQMLPLDCYGYAQATVGGVLATNQSGPRRLLFGSARDLALGLRVVLPDGSLIKAGGKVVKNVSGYDLRKLFIGSLGTLGLITEASFKVYPLPEHEATVKANFSQLEDANHAAATILHSQLTPQTLELTQPRFNEAAGREAVFPKGYTVAVGFGGLKEEVERQTREAENLARSNASPRVEIQDGQRHAALMRDMREFPATATHNARDRAVSCKTTVLVSKVAAALTGMQRIAHRHSVEFNWLSHNGLGIVHAALTARENQPADIEKLVNALTEMRQLADSSEGSLVVEAAPKSVMRKFDAWGASGPTVEIMRRIKTQFDPNCLMNPGRFVGGI